MVDFNNAVRRAAGVFREDRFHGLYGRDDMPISRDIVICKLARRFEATDPLTRRNAGFDGRPFKEEALQNVDASAALRPLAPRLQELSVVVIVYVDLSHQLRAPFDRAFNTPSPAVSVPYAVVKSELHFLIDIAGEIVGRDPARMNVK